MSTHVQKKERTSPGPCKCGCGGEVEQKAGAGRPRRWIEGHKPNRFDGVARTCACMCGQTVARKNARGPYPKYVEGHRPVVKRVAVTAATTEEATAV